MSWQGFSLHNSIRASYKEKQFDMGPSRGCPVSDPVLYEKSPKSVKFIELGDCC